MKAFGFTLMVVSAVAASVFASPIPYMKWPFVVSCIALALSMVILRKKPAGSSGETTIVIGKDTYDFKGAVNTVIATLGELKSKPEKPSLREIHSELDRLIENEIFDFSRNREELIQLGYGHYAKILSEFSRAERALNRCWSASVDGYPEESYTTLNLAYDLFVELREEMAALLDKD